MASYRSVGFSFDGKRIVTTSGNEARIWDLVPGGKTSPEWLPRVAEAIAGEHLSDQGVFELPKTDPVEMLEEIKDQLTRESSDDDWVAWGRWFLDDRPARTISPFSTVTVPDYIENRIKENTSASLDEAEQLAIGNAELLKRIAQARQALLQQTGVQDVR